MYIEKLSTRISKKVLVELIHNLIDNPPYPKIYTSNDISDIVELLSFIKGRECHQYLIVDIDKVQEVIK